MDLLPKAFDILDVFGFVAVLMPVAYWAGMERGRKQRSRYELPRR